MNKDREVTKQRLLGAVGEVLVERGYAGIGVNAIAKKAGVDKVLIYRYFNDLDGLLEAFVLRKDFVSNLRKFFGDRNALATKKDAVALGKKYPVPGNFVGSSKTKSCRRSFCGSCTKKQGHRSRSPCERDSRDGGLGPNGQGSR